GCRLRIPPRAPEPNHPPNHHADTESNRSSSAALPPGQPASRPHGATNYFFETGRTLGQARGFVKTQIGRARGSCAPARQGTFRPGPLGANAVPSNGGAPRGSGLSLGPIEGADLRAATA